MIGQFNLCEITIAKPVPVQECDYDEHAVENVPAVEPECLRNRVILEHEFDQKEAQNDIVAELEPKFKVCHSLQVDILDNDFDDHEEHVEEDGEIDQIAERRTRRDFEDVVAEDLLVFATVRTNHLLCSLVFKLTPTQRPQVA